MPRQSIGGSSKFPSWSDGSRNAGKLEHIKGWGPKEGEPVGIAAKHRYFSLLMAGPRCVNAAILTRLCITPRTPTTTPPVRGSFFDDRTFLAEVRKGLNRVPLTGSRDAKPGKTASAGECLTLPLQSPAILGRISGGFPGLEDLN